MKRTTQLAAAVFVTGMLAAGCSQHGDLPTQQTYIPPPDITSLEIFDQGGGLYDIDWEVADDTGVSFYRVYAFGLLSGLPELALETEDTIAGVDVGAQIGGLRFGVTAVTIENVEGAMATAVTPTPGTASP